MAASAATVPSPDTANGTLKNRDTLVLMLGAPDGAHGDGAVSGITRLTKLLFLAAVEGGFADDENFEFVPYKYGPFARDLYATLRTLVEYGLVEVLPGAAPDYYQAFELQGISDQGVIESARALGYGTGAARGPQLTFRLTPKGRRVAEALRGRLTDERWRKLTGIKSKYGRWPLNELLAYLYRRYPEWAAQSVHPLAKQSA